MHSLYFVTVFEPDVVPEAREVEGSIVSVVTIYPPSSHGTIVVVSGASAANIVEQLKANMKQTNRTTLAIRFTVFAFATPFLTFILLLLHSSLAAAKTTVYK